MHSFEAQKIVVMPIFNYNLSAFISL